VKKYVILLYAPLFSASAAHLPNIYCLPQRGRDNCLRR
jgi:hypothetical protein